MLSILIPVYNFDVRPLVKELYLQANASAIDFEILCYDDGSDDKYQSLNHSISSSGNIIYKEFQNNQGRAKMRNRLAKDAKYDFLLFLDCDIQMHSKQFIATYLPFCTKDTVVIGGIKYSPSPPSEPDTVLRWKYGIKREVRPLQKRRIYPYRSFLTSNFMISKTLCLSFPFDEQLTHYGHEDTLLGQQLKEKNIPITHIYNPILHIGIDRTEDFLIKTQQGINNLLLLKKQRQIGEEIKLFNTYQRIKQWHLTFLVLFVFRWSKKHIIGNLTSSNPSLMYFDFYKLAYLIARSENKVV